MLGYLMVQKLLEGYHELVYCIYQLHEALKVENNSRNRTSSAIEKLEKRVEFILDLLMYFFHLGYDKLEGAS